MCIDLDKFIKIKKISQSAKDFKKQLIFLILSKYEKTYQV